MVALLALGLLAGTAPAQAGELRSEGVLLAPMAKAQVEARLAAILRRPLRGFGSRDQKDALRRLMAYRFVAGVPWKDLTLDKELTRAAQAATDLFARLGQHSHDPPNAGLSEAAYALACRGASNSNLGGAHRVASRPGSEVEASIYDPGADNTVSVGHRRWALNPALLRTGFGHTEGFRAVYVTDRSRKDVPAWDFFAWPARGYTPFSMFAPADILWADQPSWSVHPNPAVYGVPDDATRLEVRIHPIDAIPAARGVLRRLRKDLAARPPLELQFVRVHAPAPGRPGAIVFRPDRRVGVGDRFWVTVRGVLDPVTGQSTVMEYYVQFI